MSAIQKRTTSSAPTLTLSVKSSPELYTLRFKRQGKDELKKQKRKTQSTYPTVENIKKSQLISGRCKF